MILIPHPKVVIHAIQVCAVGGLIYGIIHAEENGFTADVGKCVSAWNTSLSRSSLGIWTIFSELEGGFEKSGEEGEPFLGESEES